MSLAKLRATQRPCAVASVASVASAAHVPGADSHVAGANDVGRVEEDAAGATDILPGRAVKSDQQKTQHGDRVAIFKWCFLTNYTDISDISSDLMGMLWTLQ